MSADQRYFSTREAAIYLGCTTAALYHLVEERRIPFIKVGGKTLKFDRQRLDAWMQRQRVEPALDADRAAWRVA
jgi:excisionase family DNA binding protein